MERRPTTRGKSCRKAGLRNQRRRTRGKGGAEGKLPAMRKLWRCSARWSKTGRLTRDVKFRRRVESEQAKQKRTRNHVRHRNADVSGGQRTLPIRRLVVVGIVLMRAVRIRVVIWVNLVNQSRRFKQRVRRCWQPNQSHQNNKDVFETPHASYGCQKDRKCSN